MFGGGIVSKPPKSSRLGTNNPPEVPKIDDPLGYKKERARYEQDQMLLRLYEEARTDPEAKKKIEELEAAVKAHELKQMEEMHKYPWLSKFMSHPSAMTMVTGMV
jgi:hypothetical protein